MGATKQRARQRGGIDKLPSGALRVRVRAGVDVVSGEPHDLTEIIPAGLPNIEKVAEKARTRLLNQVDEQRHPRTNATVGALLDRYLDQFGGAASTVDGYRGLVRKHLNRDITKLKVGDLDAGRLDALYADCRRCREHCTGRPRLQHRTKRQHTCNDRCRPHKCRPLEASTIRHIHFLLAGAYKKAKRWNWVWIDPVSNVDPPAAPKPNPQPPTAPQAARIVNEAWKDPEWGTFVWVAMTAGARRGEMCALRWDDVEVESDEPFIWIRRAVSTDKNNDWVEGATKTHQQRRVALDPDTALLLREHHDRCRNRAKVLGFELPDDAFVFSAAPDGRKFPLPSSVSQRYDRLAARLNLKTTLHKLRHYSATELILAGVDVRTVGGRLGHSGGGTTTLRVYTAFISEADQRAATTLSGRMPERPTFVEPEERAKTNPQAPYEHIAAGLRQRILAGDLNDGDFAPSVHELMAEHGVAMGTAHRAIALLKQWGMVETSRGRRSVVRKPESVPELAVAETDEQHVEPVECRELLDLEVVRLGTSVRKFRAEADPNSPQDLRRLLVDAVRRVGDSDEKIGDYEMNVRYAGERGMITTFVALAG